MLYEEFLLYFSYFYFTMITIIAVIAVFAFGACYGDNYRKKEMEKEAVRLGFGEYFGKKHKTFVWRHNVLVYWRTDK